VPDAGNTSRHTIPKRELFLSADEADEKISLLESAELFPYPAELIEFLSSE